MLRSLEKVNGDTKMDTLSILEKHLGNTYSQSNTDIHKFTKDLKGINEFIGTLQTLQIALGRIEKHALKEDSEAIDFVAKSTSFMQNLLFDKLLSASIGESNFEILIKNPANLIETDGFEGILNFVNDKRGEIKHILSSITKSIAQESSVETHRAPIQNTSNFLFDSKY